MGTNPQQEETPRGVIRQFGHSVSVLTEEVAETTYGRKGGSLYPLVLLVVATAALLAALLVDAPAVSGLVGMASLVLLSIWVGGRGGRR